MYLEPGSTVRLACKRVGTFCLLVGVLAFQNTNLFSLPNNFIFKDRHCACYLPGCISVHSWAFQIPFNGQQVFWGDNFCLVLGAWCCGIGGSLPVVFALRENGRKLRTGAQYHSGPYLQGRVFPSGYSTTVHSILGMPQAQTRTVGVELQITLLRVYFLNKLLHSSSGWMHSTCED